MRVTQAMACSIKASRPRQAPPCADPLNCLSIKRDIGSAADTTSITGAQIDQQKTEEEFRFPWVGVLAKGANPIRRDACRAQSAASEDFRP